MLLIFLLLNVWTFVAADSPVPPFLTVCTRTDPKFNECALKSARAAVPFLAKGDRKFSIQPLDPLKVSHIESVAGDDKSPTSLTLHIDDLVIEGLEGSNIEEVRFDFDKKDIYFHTKTPKIFAHGKYNITGKLLVVPIRGNGDFNITITDLILNLGSTYDLIQKENGKTYMKVKETTLGYDLSRFYVYLDNLFDGNKELGAEINRFLNENWKESADAVGPVLAEAINLVFKSIMKSLTENYSYDEGFPEKIP